MHPRLFPTSCLFLVIVFLSPVPTCLGADDKDYTNCAQLFQCGNLANIGYPFRGGDRPSYCGHSSSSFELSCKNNVPEITIESTTYRVLAIDNTSQVLTVARNDYWNTVCPSPLRNVSLDTTHFSYGSDSQNMTLYYNCRMSVIIPNYFNCSTTNSTGIFVASGVTSALDNSLMASCNTSVIVGVNNTEAVALAKTQTLGPINLTRLLDTGFGLRWNANNSDCERCAWSGGRCGSNSNSFACYCPDQAYELTCGNSSAIGGGGPSGTSMKIALPIAGAIIAGVGLGWIIFSCRQRRKRISAQSALAAESKEITSPPLSKGLITTPSTNFTRSIPSYPSSKSDFGKGSTYFGVQVFSYTELEEATDNFDPSRQLGEGGFGTVYYGQLQDGRVVAVKRLFENNFRRVEQFMNEVEILTRLRHENLVTLFGCTSRRSRELLLVYEYIPNGTVADHLHGKKSNSGLLSWPVRLSIAIETANALAYLHATDIIHRDVKTNNILLDNDFRVKVADFGLSRLFPTDVTHVSTAPQGTPGYVDPEYYQCYQLTEKSDVYSFGVVLIELISSKQAVDTNRNRHDINLANMAVNKIQNHTLHELVDPSLGFETNNLVRRMTTLVAELAFRCLQMERDMRPSMQEVRDALKGIKNEEMNAQQAEVVDIVIEDDVIGLLKGNPDNAPMSTTSESAATEKLVSSSTTPNSSA